MFYYGNCLSVVSALVPVINFKFVTYFTVYFDSVADFYNFAALNCSAFNTVAAVTDITTFSGVASVSNFNYVVDFIF